MSEKSFKSDELISKTQPPFSRSLTDSKRQRLKQQQDALQAQYQLTSDKLKKLRRAYAIEAGTAVKFQLEQEIEFEQTQLSDLERDLDKIEQNLSLGAAFSDSDKQDFFPPDIVFESEPPTPSPLPVTRDNLSYKKLQDALIDAFPTQSSLKQLLSLLSSELDKNLDAIARGDNLATIVLNLIEIADAQGWVEGLIYTARELNPRNSRLRDTTQDLLRNQSKSKEEQQKILILITIPHNSRFHKEIQAIEEVIRQTTNQDLFEICVRTAVCPQEIHQIIAEEQPQIVHLCGHGMKDGRLQLEDNEGYDKPLSAENLASLFNSHNATVKCVLLNSCYSQLPTEAISKYINYVIGMNQSIQDKAAIKFVEGFYSMLGAKTSENQDVFQRAFDKGLDTIQLKNPSPESIPVLKKLLLE